MPSQFTPFYSLPDPQIRRRNLPHWEIQGATYFLTFRLADSLPKPVFEELENAVATWLSLHGLSQRHEVQALSHADQQEFRRLVSIREERCLDAGHGECVLRDPTNRASLVETLLFHDGTRYTLDSFVVMPNHVHLLLLPVKGWSLKEIVATWKKYSARRINERLGRSGSLWQKEVFDHIVRDQEKLERCRKYIGENPAKARLRDSEFHVGRGSGIS
jgi:REP element-mobilizing transposase RayT